MINLDASFGHNEASLRSMLKHNIRNEKDVYHSELCYIYIMRQLLVVTRNKDFSSLLELRDAYVERCERNRDKYQLSEKFIADIKDYRYGKLPTRGVIKRDSRVETALQLFMLVVLTGLTLMLAFYNRDLANIYIGIEAIVVLSLLYFSFTGKRVFFLAWIYALTMLGDNTRVARDKAWIQSFKYLIPENHDAYSVVQNLDNNFVSRYTVEMLHQKYVQIERSKK